MSTAQALVFLSCGGTFEKVYFPEQGVLGFDHSRISEWAATCRIAQPWRAETVMLIDSLEMNQAHRNQLAEKIAATSEDRIVVIHGTDTMVESAKTAMLRCRNTQVIVFTGAMVPASQENSDALFNLGLASAAAQILNPGVYIAMSGQIFSADKARKNRERGVFESTLDNEDPDEDTSENSGGTLRITRRKMTGFFR
jgi:L-asparaginase